MKIGVFDSGIGGKSVADAIALALPNDEIIFANDSEHVPYGTREPQEIFSFIVPIFQNLVDNGCQVIVVACNTVTTTLIEQLRQTFNVPFVAVEPMVKPAAQLTGSKVIAVCATPTTLASPRYAELKNLYAKNITVMEPDCSDWSGLIEQNEITEAEIAKDILPALELGADVIVLGCTHYHWIEQEITEITGGKAIILQPEQALITQLKRVILQLNS
jgi:glutamate racemase